MRVALAGSGTFDQGGNVFEWNEAIVSGSNRGIRGASFIHNPFTLAAAARTGFISTSENDFIGFRLVPEPGRSLLLVPGVLSIIGLAGWRRVSA